MNHLSLPFDLKKIEMIGQQYPTPFYLYDEQGIINCVADLKRAFSWNKGFREYFAVKATPNPAILKLLYALGCGVDCASEAELMLCNRLGITHEDVIFTSNDTPAEEYQLARQLGAIINLDAAEHVDYLLDCVGVPETICLRYNPGKDLVTPNVIMGDMKSAKFGMTKAQIFASVKKLAACGTKHFGIHAMLASNTLEASYFPMLARELFSLVLELRDTFGVTVSFVDLAGGIGIPYRPEETAVDILEIGDAVRRVYEELLMPQGIALSIYTELGRFLTGPYGYLVTTVLHLKETYKRFLGVDASACDLLRPAMYGAYHYITVLGKEHQAPADKYDVTGPLCENNDKFAVDRLLPQVQVGDILVMHDVGAYGHTMGFNCSGKLRPKELMLRSDGSVELIRRSQTIKDLFATFDIYPEFRG